MRGRTARGGLERKWRLQPPPQGKEDTASLCSLDNVATGTGD